MGVRACTCISFCFSLFVLCACVSFALVPFVSPFLSWSAPQWLGWAYLTQREVHALSPGYWCPLCCSWGPKNLGPDVRQMDGDKKRCSKSGRRESRGSIKIRMWQLFPACVGETACFHRKKGPWEKDRIWGIRTLPTPVGDSRYTGPWSRWCDAWDKAIPVA